MKAVLSVAALGLVVASALVAYAKTAEEVQAEMKNCAVCKFMAEDSELVENMTWECHKVDAGMLCVASVPKDMKKRFDAAHEKMMEAIEVVKTGAPGAAAPEMCGFCAQMGELTKAGAKEETIDTKTGSIMLITATDPAVLAKIHAAADHAIAEQEEMENDAS